jgi:hypothetical protein
LLLSVPLGVVTVTSPVVAPFGTLVVISVPETTLNFAANPAFVGAENFPQEFHESLESFSRREFPTFNSRQEALSWLVKD